MMQKTLTFMLMLSTLCLVGASTACSDKTADPESSIYHVGGHSIGFVDPVTGEPRVPSAEELANIQKRLNSNETSAPIVVKNSDGSTTIFHNPNMAKPTNPEIDENGS